ncbi:tetratricopeptide repeat-containing sensor histidine kinase [Aquimarina rhabdastrellae]
MKKIGIFFLIIISTNLISCSGNNNESKSTNEQQKINEYINKAKEENISNKEKKYIINQAMVLINESKNDDYKQEKLEDIARLYFDLNEFKKYKEVVEKGIKISKQLRDSLSIAKGFGNVGYYHNKVNQSDSAYFYFSKAEKIFNKVDPNSLKHGRVLMQMGQIQREFKDYVGSESNIIKALKCFENVSNKRYLRLCYNVLGISQRALERYDIAIDYYQKSKEYIDKSEKGKYQLALLHNNIGNVLKEQQKYNAAIEYYNKALTYDSLATKYPKFYARVLDNKAYIRFLYNDSTGLEASFLKPLMIRKQEKDDDGIITSNIHLAEYYQKRGNLEKSYIYAQEAKEKASQLNQKADVLESLLVLSQVSPSQEGLVYAQEYIDLSNEIQQQERVSRDKFARIRFETDRIEDENKIISRKNEILGISILAISAVFLFIYIIFKQKQSNKELEFAKSQQESNEEIYRLMLSQQTKLEEGRQMEQKRMSEELHDGVLGRLFGVRLSLDGLNQQRQGDGFSEIRHKYIAELKAIEKEIRLISHDLGTDTLLTDVAFIDVIKDFITEQCTIHKLDYSFRSDIDIDWEEIPDNKKVNLFRIIQESLQNIFKHAKADSIKVNFVQNDENIILTIIDDGIGFKSNKVKKGIGIKNITSRVQQMNGRVEFLSNIEAGTKVSISVPV